MKSNRKSTRFIRLLALMLTLAMAAAACGSSDDANTGSDDADTDADTAEPADTGDDAGGDLTFAIVAPSASDDLAFTQSMVDALDSLGITPQVTDGTFVVEEAASAIRGYAEDGVNVVVAHGTQFGASLAEIAPEFPDTTFIWGTATDTQGLDNVFAYYPEANEGGYVNGVMAAALTESGVIGVVGPVEAGDAVAYVNGFAKGAEANGAEVNITYTGSFGDVALASEAAQAHLTNNADVLTGSAQMVVGAVTVASGEGVPWFGTQANQTPMGPDVVVASQVYHWEVVLEDMIALIEAGTLGGEAFVVNLENGGLEIEFNDAFDLPAEVRTAAEDAIAGIIDGSIDASV